MLVQQVIRAPVFNGTNFKTVGETGTARGTGEANSVAIVNKLGYGTYAAKLCYDLVLSGFDDWFLPAKYLLNQMYVQRSVIGGVGSDDFWSSSEYSSDFARGQYFCNGGQFYYTHVRALRAFNY